MTANALTIGEIRFTLAPTSLKNGNWEKKLPIRRNNGLPGGWGTPIIKDVAMNSPQSQNDVVGAIVIKYSKNEVKKVIPAIILFILCICYLKIYSDLSFLLF